jgi:hypothetical protein
LKPLPEPVCRCYIAPSFFRGSERLANGEREGEKAGQSSGAKECAEESAIAFGPTNVQVGEVFGEAKSEAWKGSQESGQEARSEDQIGCQGQSGCRRESHKAGRSREGTGQNGRSLPGQDGHATSRRFGLRESRYDESRYDEIVKLPEVAACRRF